MIFFLGFFFFQSDRPTQYQETHSRVNEEKKGMALRRILFSNDTFSAQQIYQSMIMSIFTHCGYNSLGWSESRKSMIRSIEKRSAKSFPRNAVRSIGVRAIFCQGGAVIHLPKKLCKLPKCLRNSRKETRAMQQNRPYWHMKVARYSFLESIPAKFEHKLRRHKQGFGKNCHHSCIR